LHCVWLLAIWAGAGSFHSDIRRHLAKEKNDPSNAMRRLLFSLLGDLDPLERRIKELPKEIEVIARSEETITRLRTIRGIGPYGATALVAATVDG
jgi:transposase